MEKNQEKDALIEFLNSAQELQEQRVNNLKSLVSSQEKIIGFQNELIEEAEKIMDRNFKRGFLFGGIFIIIIITIFNTIF